MAWDIVDSRPPLPLVIYRCPADYGRNGVRRNRLQSRDSCSVTTPEVEQKFGEHETELTVKAAELEAMGSGSETFVEDEDDLPELEDSNNDDVTWAEPVEDYCSVYANVKAAKAGNKSGFYDSEGGKCREEEEVKLGGSEDEDEYGEDDGVASGEGEDEEEDEEEDAGEVVEEDMMLTYDGRDYMGHYLGKGKFGKSLWRKR